MITDPTEVGDFETALREKGFSRADFELTSSETPFPGGHLAAARGTVTIANTKRDLSKTYRAGSGSSWPAEFYLDLQNGVFGEP